MSDSEEDAEGPAIPLGEGEAVEGAPLARVTSRLHYAIGKQEVIRREGDTVIRTPDGPQELASVLEAADGVYFDTRQALKSAVRDVIGTGAVPTAEESEETGGEEETEASETPKDPEEAPKDAEETADDETVDEDTTEE
jgi:hypothetical protein